MTGQAMIVARALPINTAATPENFSHGFAFLILLLISGLLILVIIRLRHYYMDCMIQQNVLIIGSGGREHALAWKIAQSPLLGKLFLAPGNAGTRAIATNVPVAATDIPGLIDFAKTSHIDLTVVGPDDILAIGMVDAFQKEGLRIFGPTKAAARIESSKAFSK